MAKDVEKGTDKGTTRRGFLGAVVGAVAGLAVGVAAGSYAFPRVVEKPVAAGIPSVKGNEFTWKEPGKTNIVVIGGGPGGVSFVRYLVEHFKESPPFTITIIDKEPYWVSGPSHVDFVGGMRNIEEVTVSIANLELKNVVRFVNAEVAGLDPENRVVHTNIGFTRYDYLVLSPGIELATWEIEWLSGAPNLHAWKPGTAIKLGEAVKRLREGTIVLSAPPSPYKCPPGPYEVANLIGEATMDRRDRVKIVFIDAKPNPEPGALASIFKQYFEKYGIEYVPGDPILRVDPMEKVVETEKGEKFKYDVLSILPRNVAPDFARAAGLGDRYIEVDLSTFRSKKYDDIYAIGDAAQLPVSKAAFAATNQGQRLADIFAGLLGKSVKPATVSNICWPYVSKTEATIIEVAWDENLQLQPGYPKVQPPSKELAQTRASWEMGLLGLWRPLA
ncbi:putative NAD(FAD)-dependent dehydrogenase [Pyrobaculum oguniense TE7]|uniref:NAD(FAD)-dependent dehydrogenase n=1 Tax=Pyrobaculum oguniense (strain DSM 13380 / JCM 10595 / TE7) TaxID=698757 RepID=H6QCF3_PYROT|nr:putative NAD(FAD)-dependent dehydrogenase [Pyrobaculum oguniense TE7]